MDGQINEWIDGGREREIRGWKEGREGGREGMRGEYSHGWLYNDGGLEGWLDGWIDGRMDE